MNDMVPLSLIKEIARILHSGETSPFFHNFDGGPNIQEFEKEFARYVGTRYAVSVANGSLALNAAYTALADEMRPKPIEAITTPYTFIATVSELVRADVRPVFGDIDPETFALDANSTSQRIGPRTRMIVVMHPLGVPVEMDGFLRIAKDQGKNAPIICEDAAQALGSTFRGKKCGSYGRAACFSLQQTKSLSTGEGGVVVTDDREVYDKLRHLRNHGNKYGPFRKIYSHMIATNYRLTEIQAAIAVHALRNYDKVVSAQRRRARVLIEAIQSSRVFVPQKWPDHSEPNGYIVGCRIRGSHKARGRFLRMASRFNKGIPGYVVGGGYAELAYQLPALRYLKASCPTAEAVVRDAVWVDARKMPMEVVKELARTIEGLKG